MIHYHRLSAHKSAITGASSLELPTALNIISGKSCWKQKKASAVSLRHHLFHHTPRSRFIFNQSVRMLNWKVEKKSLGFNYTWNKWKRKQTLDRSCGRRRVYWYLSKSTSGTGSYWQLSKCSEEKREFKYSKFKRVQTGIWRKGREKQLRSLNSIKFTPFRPTTYCQPLCTSGGRGWEGEGGLFTLSLSWRL